MKNDSGVEKKICSPELKLNLTSTRASKIEIQDVSDPQFVISDTRSKTSEKRVGQLNFLDQLFKE